MNAEILRGFVEQAESSLPSIRRGILLCAREGDAFGELNSAIAQISSIKEAASIVDCAEIEKTAAELEEKLKSFVGTKEKLTDEQSRRFLDEVIRLETLVTKVNFSLDDFSIDVADFVDDYFENIQIRPAAPEIEIEIVDEPEAEDEPEEEFEIDEEMLEVFALEAEELVQGINANLKILENSRNDREALLEVRRNAHTLKGSAGIVGLKKLSQVAHRVEDLLDYMAEHEIDADDRIFQLLTDATDCFEALASNENSAQTETKIARVYQNCDEILASLEKKTATASLLSAADSATKSETASLPPGAGAAENQIQILPAQNRSVVRVSLEKLDDLVRCVSGLVVSRSVFEQRLTELKQQIDELRHSAQRLQFSANRLEVDFEAGMTDAETHAHQSPFADYQSRGTEIRSSPSETENQKSAIGNRQAFDALELDRYTEFNQISRELTETAADNAAINWDLTTLRSNFETLFDSQRRLIDEMQDKLLHLRMVSFGLLAVRLQRTVRVTCDEEDKQAELFIEGETLEIDTLILDSLVEPLLHLLRNAVAHGIESPETRRLVGKPEAGKIFLRAYNDGTHLVLTIQDDGRGISAAALKKKAVENRVVSREAAEAMTEDEAFALIFLPGLTTAEKLSQISGRGVGMNIVKANILRRQGTISIQSERQKGTTFTIRLPLPLAIVRALPVKSGGQIFAFPLKLVREATEISRTELRETVQIGGTNYTVAQLDNLLRLPTLTPVKNASVSVLLIEAAEKFYALVVDEILKPEEIVIKKLGLPLQNFAQLLGAATLGDGNVIPVLDLLFLLEQKVQSPKSKVQSPPEIQNSRPEDQTEIQSPKSKIINVLIVDDSPSVRHLTSKVIKNAGMTTFIAKDGLEALEILHNSAQLPNVILTDVEMPRMDGYELLASLKKEKVLCDIPVVMITSRAGEKHRRKAFELGVSDYLTKPFADAVLIEKVKNLVKV